MSLGKPHRQPFGFRSASVSLILFLLGPRHVESPLVGEERIDQTVALLDHHEGVSEQDTAQCHEVRTFVHEDFFHLDQLCDESDGDGRNLAPGPDLFRELDLVAREDLDLLVRH